MTRPTWPGTLIETLGSRRGLATCLFALRIRLTFWAARLHELRSISLESLELGMAVIGAIVGVHLAHPGAAERQVAALSDLGRFAPLSWWGYVLVPCALATTAGYLDQNFHLRRAAAICACAFWCYTGGVLMIRHYALYGWCLHLPMGGYNLWAFLRLGQQCVKHKYRVLRSQIAVPADPDPVRVLARGAAVRGRH